jgi:hypothetical protein
VYFSVHKHVIVENDSLEVHEEDVRYLVQYVTLSGVRPFSTTLAKTVTD